MVPSPIKAIVIHSRLYSTAISNFPKRFSHPLDCLTVCVCLCVSVDFQLRPEKSTIFPVFGNHLHSHCGKRPWARNRSDSAHALRAVPSQPLQQFRRFSIVNRAGDQRVAVVPFHHAQDTATANRHPMRLLAGIMEIQLYFQHFHSFRFALSVCWQDFQLNRAETVFSPMLCCVRSLRSGGGVASVCLARAGPLVELFSISLCCGGMVVDARFVPLSARHNEMVSSSWENGCAHLCWCC